MPCSIGGWYLSVMNILELSEDFKMGVCSSYALSLKVYAGTFLVQDIEYITTATKTVKILYF